jgi:23S rRNA pseudouridine1911/1915/1917 synthase
MPTELTSRVERAAHGQPLLEWLTERFRYALRATWAARIAGGDVRVNGAPSEPDAPLAAGDRVSYLRSDPEPTVDRAVRIVHADDDLLVADKPAHLPMHSAGPFITNTCVAVLREQLGLAPRARLHPIQRLDRETSGLCAVARTRAAARSLQSQLEAGKLTKRYLAIVDGVLVQDELRIDAPIGRHPASAVAIRRAVVDGGQPARTRCRVRARSAAFTLLEIDLETGRTHQIRVHLESIGHPVAGDVLYGRDDAAFLAFVAHVKAGGDARAFPGRACARQMLHACAVAFAHPRDGCALEFESELPEEMRAFFAAGR